MTNPVGRPLAFESVEELQEAIDSYFENEAYVGEGDARIYAPTMSGLALALGVDRKTIINYERREEYFHAVKKARARVEVALEQRLYGQAVTGIIFNLKNNFGWQDKQDLLHTSPDGSMSPTRIELVAPEDNGDSEG